MTYRTQHAKVIRLEVSIGKDDDTRTIEDWQDTIKALLHDGAQAHNVTVQGSYYLIDGKVCLPADYDPETRDRKPGTYPPVWAGGPSEADRKSVTFQADPVEEAPQEFVRVAPTMPRRDPVTGRRPRKPRSDKGVKKGPRQPVQQAS